MKEPELEEEALSAQAEGQTMTITRRTLSENSGDVELIAPDGSVVMVPLEEVRPGRFEAVVEGPEIGLYRLREGDEDAVIALGPAAPKEFEQTIANAALLEPAVDALRGGIIQVSDGVPDLRHVRMGRPAAGRDWLDITPREAYLTADVTVTPIVRAWLFLLLGSLLIIAGWLREGRR